MYAADSLIIGYNKSFHVSLKSVHYVIVGTAICLSYLLQLKDNWYLHETVN